MSEHAPQRQHNRNTSRLLTSTALAAILAGGAGAIGGYHVAEQQSKPDAHQTIKEILEEEKMADLSAASYSKTLRENTPVALSVLNGDVVLPGKHGFPTITYKNPIALFSSEALTVKTDVNGDFLENKWFGIRAWNLDGQLDIVPVQFEQENGMLFKAHDPNNLVLNASVVPQWPQKGGPNSEVLAAFDVITQQPIKNPDGSSLIPGSIEGMK